MGMTRKKRKRKESVGVGKFSMHRGEILSLKKPPVTLFWPHRNAEM